MTKIEDTIVERYEITARCRKERELQTVSVRVYGDGAKVYTCGSCFEEWDNRAARTL